MTPAEELFSLMGRFTSRVPFSDSPTGFFGILGATFDQLAAEETAACNWDGLDTPLYPPFGAADDQYEPIPKAFYAIWSSFTTNKSFSWKDKYRLTDAPDRRIRRLMEKENKKLRDDAIREFNDAVRSLVAFVKKRDPRYKPNTQSEAERQAILRESVAAQAARSRAANQEKLADFVVPEWVSSRDDVHQDSEFEDSEVETIIEQIECVVCDKTFKSEKQFEAHEKSKKHKQAIQVLRRRLKKEDKELGLDLPAEANPSSLAGEADAEDSTSSLGPTSGVIDGKEADLVTATPGESLSEPSGASLSDDSDYVSREEVGSRVSAPSETAPGTRTGDEADGSLADSMGVLQVGYDSSPTKTMGKAAQKRQKKAAKQANEESNASAERHICNVCRETFPSRSKLFDHIKGTGHALASGPAKGSGKRRGKR
jgi:DnaJ homolog subfamily A member 5